MKKCSTCKEKKPLTDFYKNKAASKTEFYSECKKCNKIRAAKTYQDKKILREKQINIEDPPSYAAINGHIRFRGEQPKKNLSPEHFDKKKYIFKVYAHNVYLFDDHDKDRAIRRAESLGYFESSIKFV